MDEYDWTELDEATKRIVKKIDKAMFLFTVAICLGIASLVVVIFAFLVALSL